MEVDVAILDFWDVELGVASNMEFQLFVVDCELVEDEYNYSF